jgi:hypothetical protein
MATRKGQLTKTVVLSGGMQDDVSEFQQADPSAAYIENGRFRKKDEIEKRLPDTALTTTNLPAEGSPLMLASPKGKSLLTIDSGGTLYSFDPDTDDTWQTRETTILPFSSEVDFRSAPEPGMGTIAAGEATNDSVEKFKLMAWENRDQYEEHLVVECRRPNGDLWFRERVPAGQEPKIRQSDFYNRPTLFYTTLTTDDLFWSRKSGNGLASGTVMSGLYTGTHPFITAMVAEGSIPNGAEDLLPGCDSDNHRFWDIDFGAPTDLTPIGGAVVFLDDSTAYGRVKIAKMNTYSSMGTEYFLHTNSSTDVEVPLAISYNPENNDSGVLCAQYSPASKFGKLVFYRFDHDTNSIVDTISYRSPTINNEWWTKASIRYDSSAEFSQEGWRFAATVCGGDPDLMNAAFLAESTATVSGRVDDFNNTFDIEHNWFNHTLASELTFDIHEYNPTGGDSRRRTVFALEQWNPHAVPNVTGNNNNSPNYTNEFFSVPVLIRPHSTIVVSTQAGDDYKIIATIGAGQNKCDDADRNIVNCHLNGAYNILDDDAPRIVTRNVLQPMDISWKWSNPANGDRCEVLYNGEAAAKVTKLTPATTLKSRVYGETTLFASAVPTQYDGVAYGEQSVFDQPEITFVGQRAASDADGTLDYQGWGYEQGTTGDVDDYHVFTVVVSFADHQGHLHRSAPSTPLWVYGMQENENFIDGHVGFTPPLTAYGAQRDYFVEVYVAQGEGAPHLAASKSFNAVNVSEPYIDFKMHHFANNNYKYPVRWSEVLYTEGDVLPSDPWPSFNDFVLTSNRMFAISSEVPGTVYYSKLLEENIAPEFSAALVLSLGRNRTLTAIGKIDDKVIVFTDDNEIFAIYDTGPDNTGANGDFVIDQLQTTIGCDDTDSLVEIPEGLLFYSSVSNEFHLLSRDLQVHDIGKAIEDTANSLTNIKTAIVVPDEHEVRWYVDADIQREWGEAPATPVNGIPARPPRPRYQNVLPASGPVLVYNYHYKKWCVFSGQDAQHTVLYQGQPTYITSDWDVFQADEDAWAEEQHQLTIRTPWIRVNQLQSFGRIDECVFLVKYLSDWYDNGNGFEAGDIKVRVRYDYEARSANFDNNTEYTDYLFRANNGDLGGKRTEEQDIAEGGAVPIEIWYGRCQFSVHPDRPKCQAIQFEITDELTTPISINEPTNYAIGRGFSIAGVDLLYSVKTGTGMKTSPQGPSK